MTAMLGQQTPCRFMNVDSAQPTAFAGRLSSAMPIASRHSANRDRPLTWRPPHAYYI